MGLFDSVKLELKFNGRNYQDVDFQTKSLDNSLSYYLIDKDGKLFIMEYDMIELPKLKSKKKGIEGFIESMQNYKRTNERFEPYYFHGDIYIYGSKEYDSNTLDFHFVIRYFDGNFQSIYKATEDGQTIYSDGNKEFIALNELPHFIGKEFMQWLNKKSIFKFKKPLYRKESIWNFFQPNYTVIVDGVNPNLYTEFKKYKLEKWRAEELPRINKLVKKNKKKNKKVKK